MFGAIRSEPKIVEQLGSFAKLELDSSELSTILSGLNKFCRYLVVGCALPLGGLASRLSGDNIRARAYLFALLLHHAMECFVCRGVERPSLRAQENSFFSKFRVSC
jgi:hypothetical protein